MEPSLVAPLSLEEQNIQENIQEEEPSPISGGNHWIPRKSSCFSVSPSPRVSTALGKGSGAKME